MGKRQTANAKRKILGLRKLYRQGDPVRPAPTYMWSVLNGTRHSGLRVA